MCAGTVTANDSLDLLAEFMGCGDLVAEVTNKVNSTALYTTSLALTVTLLSPAMHDSRVIAVCHSSPGRLYCTPRCKQSK